MLFYLKHNIAQGGRSCESKYRFCKHTKKLYSKDWFAKICVLKANKATTIITSTTTVVIFSTVDTTPAILRKNLHLSLSNFVKR